MKSAKAKSETKSPCKAKSAAGKARQGAVAQVAVAMPADVEAKLRYLCRCEGVAFPDGIAAVLDKAISRAKPRQELKPQGRKTAARKGAASCS